MAEDLLEKKIAVIGVGGVGGYLAGMLLESCPHVTLVARGARKRALKERGLVLHSDYHGEKVLRLERIVASARELGRQDYIFICVKNYSLEEVCRELKGQVEEHTVIVPVMNGVDPGDRTRALLGAGTVVDSLIYIVAFSGPDYAVTQQGDFASLRVGIPDADGEEQRKADEVGELLCRAGIDCKVAGDIRREIWRKYILNCAFNVETAYYDEPIGPLRADPEKAKEYEALIREAYQVARAKGVRVTQDHVDGMIHKFYHDYAEDATSSLQRDIRAGHQSELDTFSGYLVREARRLGVETPVSGRMYEGLKKRLQGEGREVCTAEE